MSNKNETEVVIGGRILTLMGEDSPEHFQKIASYINEKIAELGGSETYKFLGNDMRTLMLQLNIVDDYFKEKEIAESLAAELEKKEEEIYTLKQEIIEARMKLEKTDNGQGEFEGEIEKLNSEIERLKQELFKSQKYKKYHR